MKAFTRIISFALFAIMLCLTVAMPIFAKVSYNDIKNESTEELKAQLDAFNAIKKDLQAQLDAAEGIQATAKEKRELYMTLQSIYDDEIALLNAQLEASEVELAAVNDEVERISREYDEIYADMRDVIRMAHEGQDTSYIALVLGSSSISDLFARIERANALVAYNNNLLEKLEQKQKEVDLKAAELKEKNEQQAAALAEVEGKQAEIAAWEKENEAALLEIEAELDRLIGEYEEFDDEEDILREEFDKMVDALIKKEEERIKSEEEKRRQEAIEAANKKNTYLWPLPASYTRLSSYFNEKRTIPSVGIANRVHYGIDIPAPRGTPIYAVKAGTVTRASYDANGYGYYVIIDHGDKISTLYAHCSKLLVSKGDVVERGDTIALIGTTGCSTGNHLHFEFRINSKKYDPLDYIPKPQY